ncbi:MAG: DUF4870 domain-containing protein [Cocleimonas sp.]
MSKLQPYDIDERKWAMIIHGAAFSGLIFPLGLVLGPTLVWFFKRKDSIYLDAQGRKVINFQLTILIAVFVLFLLSIIIRPFFIFGSLIGLLGLVFAAIAGISIYNTGDYNYPFSLKLI